MSKQPTPEDAMRRIDQAAILLLAKDPEAAGRILEELISDAMEAGNLSEDLHLPDLRRMAVKCTVLAITRMNTREKA